MAEALPSPVGTTTPLMGRIAMIASAVLVLSAVEVGWWWFQRFRHLQYRKDHPNTIFLTEFRPRPTRWGRAVFMLLRVLWTLLILATFGGCVALDFVLVRGVGTAARCVASGSAALWEAPRARLAARTKGARPPNETSHTATTSSTFVLAPILRSKPTVPTTPSAGPPFRASSLQWANKGAKKGVTFQEHSNWQIRRKQVSFDPASATSFSVEESRTPPPGQSEAPSQQPSKARMAQTPPLPRRGRAMGDKENDRVASEVLRGIAHVERPSDHAAPATPQSSRTPESVASIVSRPVIPPYPGPSAMLEESLRKRRASSSSHGYSPAVKRMYGRLRLPPQAASQVPYQYQPHVVARKMKRQRENDLILWKAFTTVPSAGKKAAVEAGSAVPDGSGEAAATSQSSHVGPIPLASSKEAAGIATSENSSTPNPPAAFHFGSSAPATTPLASDSAEGTPAVGNASTGGAAAPESSTAGAVAATSSGMHFGFGHPASAAIPNGGTGHATPSGGATFNPGEAAAPTFPSQLGLSSSKPEVNATTDKSGSPFPLGIQAPASDYSATPLTQNPGGPFQASFSSGVLHSTDDNAVPNTGGEASAPQRQEFGGTPNTSVTAAPSQANFNPSSNVPAAAAAHPAATTLQSSVPAANSASTASFQFGFGNPQQTVTAANSPSVPPPAFGPKTPDPAAQPSLTPASSTVFTFGAGPEQAMGTGGASAPTFQFGSNAFGAQGFGVGTNGVVTGGFAMQPASSGTMSTAPFAFGQTAAQSTSAAQSFASSTFSGAIGTAPARPRVPRKPSRARPPRR